MNPSPSPARPFDSRKVDLLSTVGAGVLGAGIGLLLEASLRPFTAPILAVGLLTHGVGMTLRHRLDGHAQLPMPLWSWVLYWVCWAGLAALAFIAFGPARPL